MSRLTKRTYPGIVRNRKDRMARKWRPKVYEDQARRMFIAAITTSLPEQINRGERKVLYRLQGYNAWVNEFFETYERIKCLSYQALSERLQRGTHGPPHSTGVG